MSSDHGSRLRDQPPQSVIDFAIEVSQWSPCQSKRGAVIFDGENILSRGYNYKSAGFDCDGSASCKATCRIEAVHAEQQALLSRGPNPRGTEMLHVKTVNGALVPSGGPSCVECSKLALVAGIAGFWLYHAEGWRRYEMTDFHRLSIEADALLRASASAPPEPDNDYEVTLRSIATMLGWVNLPPRRTLEMDIAALKARASASALSPEPDNGNVWIFCDFVQDRRACVRGAGHNGPHAMGLHPHPQEPIEIEWDAEGRCETAYAELAGAALASPRETEPERVLKSIATMLGWMNVPPLRVFEQEIAALKARARLSGSSSEERGENKGKS